MWAWGFKSILKQGIETNVLMVENAKVRTFEEITLKEVLHDKIQEFFVKH